MFGYILEKKKDNLSMCKKILIITPFYFGIGGAETFTKDLIKALKTKYEVHLSTINYTKTWQGILKWKAIKIVIRLLPKSLWKCLTNKYEKIYCLGLMSSFIGFLLFWKKKYAIMLCLYDFKRRNIFLSIILNSFEKIFVEGGEIGKKEMEIIGIKPEKIIKFNEWIDQSLFKSIDRNNDKMRVLFVGRPIYKKGRYIIEQVEKELKGVVDFEYITDIPYEDLPKHYQMADVVVVPSLYSEGFSRVVVEAASCGCAVITSDRGALPELVKDFGSIAGESAGYIWGFKEIILYYYNNRDILKYSQKKTVEYAKEHFNEKNAEIFL